MNEDDGFKKIDIFKKGPDNETDKPVEQPVPYSKQQTLSSPMISNEPSCDDDDDEAQLQLLLKAAHTEIKVIGCGGAGGNTILGLVNSGVTGVTVGAINTDAQDLVKLTPSIEGAKIKRILIGKKITRGKGAGADPKIGRQAAEEDIEQIKKFLADCEMIFITCGLGGGTGTGSAPVVAKLAKSMGCLTVCVVTTPFRNEGSERMDNALKGLEELKNIADTIILIPNDKLLDLGEVSITEAFKAADSILVNSIRGLSEIITKPGQINLDFNDVKKVMSSSGQAIIGLGEAEGENRAISAVKRAIESPLLKMDISKSNACLINITYSPNKLTMNDENKIIGEIKNRIAPNANIIKGLIEDGDVGEKIRVTVVLTGVRSEQITGTKFNNNNDEKKSALDDIIDMID